MNYQYSKTKELGLTLMEIVAVFAVGSIAGILLIQIFAQNSNLLYTQSAQVSHNLDLNSSVSEIEKSIRVSQMVASGYPESSPTYTTSANTLVLKASAFDGYGNLLQNAFDFIIIIADSSNSNVLRRLVFPTAGSVRAETNQVISTTLSAINFSYLDDNGSQITPIAATKINFSITVSTRVGSNIKQNIGVSEVNLRNN